MTEEGTSSTVSRSVNKTTSYEDNDDDNIIHSKITSAMRARVPHFQKESSSLTLEGVRRLLEKDMELDKFSLDKHKRFLRECLAEDLKLEQRAIDTHKDFISEELDEVIASAEASESKSVSKKKNIKKSNSNASNRVTTEKSSKSFGNQSDEEEEDVTPRKKIVSKRKAQSSEGLKKRKRPENNAKSRKKNVKSKKTKSEGNGDDNDSVVDSEDKYSQSSAENPTKKREISTPGYGKHAEHLRSVIKACGLSVPPVIYKKVRQFPEGKREAQLIKELEEILSREGLSSRPSEKEINDVRKRREKAKELEGIDTSNIISSSRSRRSTTSFIPPPKTKIPDIDDSGEESDDDNNEDNASESDVPSEEVSTLYFDCILLTLYSFILRYQTSALCLQMMRTVIESCIPSCCCVIDNYSVNMRAKNLAGVLLVLFAKILPEVIL
ncbi:hypothetical protein ACFE04_014188 [Oxalis oulophora]